MRIVKTIIVVVLWSIFGFGMWNFSEKNHVSVNDEYASQAEIGWIQPENDFGQHQFFETELLSGSPSTRPTNQVRIPVRPSFTDFSFHCFFKNFWRYFSTQKSNMLKLAWKDVICDVNSSHYSFPCRYHVLALQEIII